MDAMRTLHLTITTALAALALGACGSDGSAGGGTGSSPRDAAFDGALKFARCMRGEGLDFPDPKRAGNGMIQIGGHDGPRLNPNDPKLEAARKKCGKYLEEGGGDAPDPAQQAKFQDAFLQYARCMRREGVNIPDPKPGAGGGIIARVGDQLIDGSVINQLRRLRELLITER